MTELSDTFKENLSSEIREQASRSQRMTAREAVRECLEEIRWGREKSVPWDAIAEAVRKSVESTYGVSISLAGYTARRYYYELISGSKKKGKKSKSRSRPTSATSQQSKASAQAAAPAPATEPAPTPEPVAQSPVAAEPQPESATTTADESPAADQPATSTEELHPNRFRDRFKEKKNPRVTTGYENCKTL